MTNEPKLFPHAPPASYERLLQVLEVIAAIPLAGEDIADEDTRAEFIETAEYDETERKFQPERDTEIHLLHTAVLSAREAVAIVKRLRAK